jgi:hypothetical protein
MNDDDLMERLRGLAGTAQGVPELVDQAARAALSTRRLDAELAELVLDSHAEDTASPVRGDDQARLLTFRTADVTVELEVRPAGDTVDLRGFATGTSGEVVVETATGRRHRADVDPGGWFSVEHLPRTSARLLLTGTGGTAVTTSWTLL